MWSFFGDKETANRRRTDAEASEPAKNQGTMSRETPIESKGFTGSSLRTTFSAQDCTTVAYPSAGGFVISHSTSCELDWLGLSRSEESKPDPDPGLEDAFALKLLQLGGQWWPNSNLYSKHTHRAMDIPYGHHLRPIINVGYPSAARGSGVWILKTVEPGRVRVRSSDPPERPGPWVRAIMAQTMDDRCEILQGFGAVFYAAVEECPDIPKSLKEGIEIGRASAKLLTKMEDDFYVDEWIESVSDDIYEKVEPDSE